MESGVKSLREPLLKRSMYSHDENNNNNNNNIMNIIIYINYFKEQKFCLVCNWGGEGVRVEGFSQIANSKIYKIVLLYIFQILLYKVSNV